LSKVRVMVVDDEPSVRRFLKRSLMAHGYDVLEAETGETALDLVALNQPDLVILDLGLPDVSGITVVQNIREWSLIPIIILSVRNQEKDKISALDNGADDYLTKPFGVGELMARLRVALRRQNPELPAEPIFKVGDLFVDLSARIVMLNKVEIQLTPTEYDLLRLLVKYAGRVITHQQLLREIRGVGYQTETQLLRVHMSNLRRKLETDPTNPAYILTESGVGYRLRSDM
jgi:two-component system, OmpR family, KDP operon response regulator KdpE